MPALIANARMYAVTPQAERAWAELLGHIGESAGVALAYRPHPAPASLDDLWARPDLGAVFMCGFPLAMRRHRGVPIAAPVPRATWASGHALYRSDLVVRADSPFRTLADTFGGRLAWTIDHSHSGFNALRHHLLAHRTPARPALYLATIGPLVTPRRVIEAVLAGEADIGPLDAYVHLLLARHEPDLVAGLRVVDATARVPIPPLVAAAGTDVAAVARLGDAFLCAHQCPWFAALADTLLIDRFAPAAAGDYAPLRRMADEAEAAGYAAPA